MAKSRIGILDSFRAIAILSVIFFHFFSRWTPPLFEQSYYHYTNTFNYFNRGYLGVQFFFIISGFVIFFTLENTEKFNTFWKKRLIRLMPSMLVASIITFCFVSLFDTKNIFPEGHYFKNFIPSLTFISPKLLSLIPTSFTNNIFYISGTYWSLWTEVQFYVFSSILYFLDKDKFFNRIVVISISVISVNYILQNITKSNILHLPIQADFLRSYSFWSREIFNIVVYLPFFCLGVIFFRIYKIVSNEGTYVTNSIKIYGIFIALYIIYSGIHFSVRIIYLLMILAFIFFIYKPKILSFLETPWLIKIGESSYFLYLIHESIGIIIIFSFFKFSSSIDIALVFLLIFSLIIMSYIYTAKVEPIISKWLKSKIL